MTDERNRIIELLDEVIELKKELLGTVQLRAELAAARNTLELITEVVENDDCPDLPLVERVGGLRDSFCIVLGQYMDGQSEVKKMRAELVVANARLEEASKDKQRLESRTIRLYAPTEFAEHVIFEDVDLRAAIDDAMERHAIQKASYERQISVWLHDRLAHSDGEAIREASLERHISRPGNE